MGYDTDDYTCICTAFSIVGLVISVIERLVEMKEYSERHRCILFTATGSLIRVPKELHDLI